MKYQDWQRDSHDDHLSADSDDAPLSVHFEPIQPDTLTNAPISIPQQLADCIETANLIDEKVVDCRYGTLPRDHRSAPSSGMVSKQYLAQYKADQAKRSHTPAQRSANRDVDMKWIKGWDGDTSYLAEWHALDNRIDSSSVCINHRRGSIDYRECRKAAKVHFREQCRNWEKRWARDQLEWSKQMEQRYCSAANGFSPMDEFFYGLSRTNADGQRHQYRGLSPITVSLIVRNI